MSLVLPQSVEVERAVLRCLLTSESARHVGLGLLRPEDFSVPSHRELLVVVREMYERGSGVSELLVKEELASKGRLEARVGTLDGVMQTESDASHLRDYLTVLQDHTLRRGVMSVSDWIVDNAHGSMPTGDMVNHVESMVYGLRSNTEDASSGLDGEALIELFDRPDDPAAQLREYGLNELNRVLGGYAVGDLITIAAYTSDGKTSLGLSESLNAARRGRRVGIFSLEMTARQNVQRLLAMVSGVKPVGQLSLDEEQALESAKQEIMQLPIKVYASSGITPSRVRSVQMRERFDVIMFDHLHRLNTDDWSQYGRWARQLKDVALDTECTVLMLSQLTKVQDVMRSEHYPKPTMRQLRGSDEISMESNTVLLLYANRHENQRTGTGEVMVVKARDGAVDWSVPLVFNEDRIMWMEAGE